MLTIVITFCVIALVSAFVFVSYMESQGMSDEEYRKQQLRERYARNPELFFSDLAAAHRHIK